MRLTSVTVLASLAAGPAFAAKGPFFSLGNSDFVVLISFLLFIGILIYLKVPKTLGGLLQKRATDIKSELDEARALREEAQSLLASYERKQKEVQEHADRIVAQAKVEAQEAADAAKSDLDVTIARRIKAAEDQIASAEAGAVKEVRDRAITVAVDVAKEMIANNMDAAQGQSLIENAIKEVQEKLH
ncbi:MAG: F0F1 ATP synthase subunit B [Pseudomonadota bacterium]